MSSARLEFVGAGGVKLAHALDAFHVDPQGLRCVDLGCSTGGFTDCLLARGAASVVALDTAYGAFAWKLRQDGRVTLLERTNALRATPASTGLAPGDLVVVDLGWTRQAKAVPAALAWLAPGPCSRIVTLIKPQYEAKAFGQAHRLRRGVLSRDASLRVLERCLASLPALGVEVLATAFSPVVGGTAAGQEADSAAAHSRGNVELFALLRRAEEASA